VASRDATGRPGPVCPGVLIWFDVDPVPGRWEAGVVIECSACGYIVTNGNFHDASHAHSQTIRGAV
jgi:hypothetical protein